MNSSQKRFLIAILGEDGAAAVAKASERNQSLGNAILPRAILSWLDLATRFEYDGGLPGQSTAHVVFRKSETGFSGSIKINDDLFTFQDASLYRLAASIGVALGADREPLSPELKDLDLVRLGKTLDALVKTRIITEELQKARKNKVKKADLPGQTAKPIKQQGPIGPQAPVKQPRQTRPPIAKFKPPTLKVEKAEAEKNCQMCGQPNFQDHRFVGCACLSDLAKNVDTTAYSDGYVLEFKGRDWDEDTVLGLVRSLTGGDDGR